MSLYQELAEQTEKLIVEGVLRPGERLPSVRQACQAHEVAPITVTQAYYLLESRGLIEARPRSGYFVRARLGQRLPEPEMPSAAGNSTGLQVSDFIFQILESVRDPAVVPLGSSFPSPYLFPLDKLGRFLASAARHLDPFSTISDLPPGNEELRRQIALRYLSQGTVVSPQEIVITSGAMEGINLCLQAVTQPGDLIAIESPAFYAVLQASERLGLKVIEIPSHPRHGISLPALAEALATHPIKACLFMLNFSNPSGSRVPDASKKELIELLRQHDVPLIEDDVYAELYFGAQAPLCSKSVDRDGLIMHVSSFCQMPGARLPPGLGGGRPVCRADSAPKAVNQPGDYRAGTDRAGQLSQARHLRTASAPTAPDTGQATSGIGRRDRTTLPDRYASRLPGRRLFSLAGTATSGRCTDLAPASTSPWHQLGTGSDFLGQTGIRPLHSPELRPPGFATAAQRSRHAGPANQGIDVGQLRSMGEVAMKMHLANIGQDPPLATQSG